MELKERIFSIYCSITSDVMNAGHCIISSTNISSLINCSLYKTRKAIKELVEDGLLISDNESGYDEDEGMVYFYRGYRVTEKGRNTKQYKIESWKNSKIMAECFGGSAYGYYRVN